MTERLGRHWRSFDLQQAQHEAETRLICIAGHLLVGEEVFEAHQNACRRSSGALDVTILSDDVRIFECSLDCAYYLRVSLLHAQLVSIQSAASYLGMISVSGQDRPPNGTSAQLTRGRLILFDITERVENTLVSLSKEASWNLKLIHQCSEPHHTIPF